jgi:hypothetical protein
VVRAVVRPAAPALIAGPVVRAALGVGASVVSAAAVALVTGAVVGTALGVRLGVVSAAAVALVAGGVVGTVTGLRGSRGAECDGGGRSECGQLGRGGLHGSS